MSPWLVKSMNIKPMDTKDDRVINNDNKDYVATQKFFFDVVKIYDYVSMIKVYTDNR